MLHKRQEYSDRVHIEAITLVLVVQIEREKLNIDAKDNEVLIHIERPEISFLHSMHHFTWVSSKKTFLKTSVFSLC